jgi:acyl-coenzyme A synthetase/AMP-(fatty) acid ligase
VASLGGRMVGFAQFRNDVAWNAERLRASKCRRGLLTIKDGYWAAVGLLALLHAKSVVVLPSHPQATDPAAFDADLRLSDDFLEPAERRSGSLEELDPDQSWIELFTSGSTGQPKRISKTLREMDAEARAIEQATGGDCPNAPVFGTVPHHHLYGLTFRLFWPLATGRVLMATTYEFWESLAADLTEGAVLVTSPAHLMRIPPIRELKAARLGMVLSAGATLPDDAAAEAAHTLDCPVTDIFGSTETGVVARRLRSVAGAPWRTFPGVAVRVGQNGQMSVRSDHLSGDWLETADRIALRDDGAFDLVGRTDRIVKIEGHRISLPDLELKLRASPLVQDAAVVALETKPPSLGAAIVLTQAGRAMLPAIGAFRLGRQLRRDLAEMLAAAGLPRHWRFVESLPVAELGKSRTSDLTELFAARREEPTQPILRAERRSDETVALDLFIPANLLCLRGHFPGFPVVPGVAQLDWAVKLAADCFDLPAAVATTFQIKFKRLTVAPADVTLTLSHRAVEHQVVFEYRQGDAVLSQGTFGLHSEQ